MVKRVKCSSSKRNSLLRWPLFIAFESLDSFAFCKLNRITSWSYCDWLSADRVNVTSVRSVTRALDAWGKRIFNEIKTLLHSEPNTLLPDYSRYFQKPPTCPHTWASLHVIHYLSKHSFFKNLAIGEHCRKQVCSLHARFIATSVRVNVCFTFLYWTIF